MKIKLLTDVQCARDIHETTFYPRPGYKVKPTLPKDTILEVQEIWSNFFGQYYRCKTKDGIYDIPVNKATQIR